MMTNLLFVFVGAMAGGAAWTAIYFISERPLRQFFRALFVCDTCGIFAFGVNAERIAFWRQYGCPCCQQGALKSWKP